MKNSTNGIRTTRPIVTRLGRLVSSRSRFGGPPLAVQPFGVSSSTTPSPWQTTWNGAVSASLLPTTGAPCGTSRPTQPTSRAPASKRRAILGHLDRDRRLAQRQRDDAAPAELQHAQLGARDGARLPRQRAVERQHPILAHVEHVFGQRHRQPARRRAGDPDVAGPGQPEEARARRFPAARSCAAPAMPAERGCQVRCPRPRARRRRARAPRR